MLRVSDEHRRARLARRHGLAPGHRHGDVVAATAAMTALHATDPPSPHLAAHARVRELTVPDVETALHVARSLVKVMAMRRTLFVVERELLPAVAGSAGRRVAEAERRRLAKEADGLVGGGGDWIAAASAEVVAALSGRERSTRELRDELPHLASTFTAAAGTRWATDVPLMSRLLTILTASGLVIRATNAGHWRIARPRWTATATWLGAPLEPLEPRAGYAAVVRRWLWTFGPGTEADLVWWLGSTKTAAREALADVGAVAVALADGATGWVLPDDTADLEEAPDDGPWAALLPTLDPTTMGWKQRRAFLDPARAPYLFDTAGNAVPTVWVDGRIVGSWVQDAGERVQPVLLEDLAPGHRRLLAAEVARLDELLDGEHVTNVHAGAQAARRRLG